MSIKSTQTNKLDRIVFLILMCSFLVESGRFFISSSEVTFLKKVHQEGQKTLAKITHVTPHKYSTAVTLTALYKINSTQFEQSFDIQHEEDLNSYKTAGLIQLHYLSEQPEKAIYLKNSKISWPKYYIGCGIIFLAMVIFIKNLKAILNKNLT
jgi:hypothetical protein